jgi:isoleucyl-tRNA synthetase
MYPELRTQTTPDEREKQVLAQWKADDVFSRSVSERPADNIFSFYEGPPTVNGNPGIHHVLSRTIKDTICRYKTMQGYRVERKGGWDTHGLPVELAIEKEQGFKHKHDIIDFGIAEFNELCRRSVYANIERKDGWQAMTERMAYWVDMEHPYITCEPKYIESVWWALKQFHDKGLIYKGHKIQPYCPRCETALSSHEVALGYDSAKDPSVYVKFRRKNVAEEEYFLAWTTTPWTLLANVALAVHPDVEYVSVINKRKDKTERLILAEALIGKLEGEVEVVARAKGKDLAGSQYEPLFDFLLRDKELAAKLSGAYKIVTDEYVVTNEGTGIVHQAPAFGEDDYRVAQREGFPVIITVTTSGEISDLIPDFAGKFFKDADPDIMDALKKKGLLYRRETVEHTYPFCWRCDTPLMYYARDSWYIRVTDYRDKLYETNKTINWQPPEIGEGRFGNWLEELKDWGISRERFWGTPLPLWISEDGKEIKCAGSYADLVGAEWLDGDGKPTGKMFTEAEARSFDPHKPLVDKLAFKGKSGYLKRVPDVIDVWFDSGSMPFAQYHYPFENKELFDKAYPADYISEGIDQTRGWFYTLHAINTFLFKKPAYKNVIVNDLVLDKNGQKMSKSKGNTVNPFEQIAKYGVDAVRWNFLEGSVPWKPKLYNEADLVDVERKFFGTLLNTYSFFALYANIDGYSSNPETRNPRPYLPEMDRWIISKLNTLVKDCTEWMDAYDITRPCRAIQDFVTEELSNWYVRRSRRRFWKGEMNVDKESAYQTLHECLLTVSKLMAPVAPFISEMIFSALGGKGSVHLELYPKTDATLVDTNLEARMAKAQIISSLVRQMRERAKIRVRQPLGNILIPCANRYEIEELRKVEEIVLDEVNVKKIDYVLYGDSDVIKRKAKANFKLLGARLGKQMKSAAARIGKMTDDEIRTYDEQMFIDFDIDGEKVRIERHEIDITAEDVEGWLVATERGVTVALDTALSPVLIAEGIAREFVNRIQNLRKDSGFDVTDRIVIAVTEPSQLLEQVLVSHKDYICAETLATQITLGASESNHSMLLEIADERAKASIAKA